MKNVRPLKIGSLELPTNIIFSPLAGCSDVAYRAMVRRYFSGLVYCEMVKMEALVRCDKTTFSLLRYLPDMHPIGAQLCGANARICAESARIIEDLGFDIVDLNCGCPVDKVTKDGSGSALLKNPQRIADIISTMKAAVSIPVTLKIRMGWDANSICAAEITQLAKEAGADAVAIHGRTRAQGYKGPAEYAPIKEAVDVSRGMPVIGNGDVFCFESAQRLFDATGCAGILVARGGMGAPWLGAEIEERSQGRPFTPPETLDVLREHIDTIFRYENEKKALLDIRRVGSWYLKKGENMRQLRGQMSKLSSRAELDELLGQLTS